MGVMMRSDDLHFLNRHHYQSGEVPHKGHVVEVAASAQPSAVQRGRFSMPPADSTEGCAAQGPTSTARKKRVGDGSSTLNYAYSTRQGQERGFALREMCGSSMRLMRMSHRRAH